MAFPKLDKAAMYEVGSIASIIAIAPIPSRLVKRSRSVRTSRGFDLHPCSPALSPPTPANVADRQHPCGHGYHWERRPRNRRHCLSCKHDQKQFAECPGDLREDTEIAAIETVTNTPMLAIGKSDW